MSRWQLKPVCPLQAVARRHRALCDEEQKLFERLLGDGVRVERCEHALTGAARCSYLIRAQRKTAARGAAVTRGFTGGYAQWRGSTPSRCMRLRCNLR